MGKFFISLKDSIYITNAIVSGVNERPNMIDDGLEPGLDEADLDCGRDAGLEPCWDRGISKKLLAPDFEIYVLLWLSVLPQLFSILAFSMYDGVEHWKYTREDLLQCNWILLSITGNLRSSNLKSVNIIFVPLHLIPYIHYRRTVCTTLKYSKGLQS